jgi:hypothetical protein
MFRFEWADQKTASNLRKHGVSFDEAVSVFGDEMALTFADTDHSEMEDRSRTYGISTAARLLVVVSWSILNAVAAFGSSAQERRLVMKKASTKMADQDIPELKRDQLGKGVRGKYLKQFTQGSNLVALQPEIQKAFPTSEAVNKALASMLAFAKETQGLTGQSSRTPRKRAAI